VSAFHAAAQLKLFKALEPRWRDEVFHDSSTHPHSHPKTAQPIIAAANQIDSQIRNMPNSMKADAKNSVVAIDSPVDRREKRKVANTFARVGIGSQPMTWRKHCGQYVWLMRGSMALPILVVPGNSARCNRRRQTQQST
jgi:hypothetical protein